MNSRDWKKILTKEELRLFERLNTPPKIQDFLDDIPANFERAGETLMSPRRMLQKKKAHCMEGALFAAAIFWFHGEKPLLLDLVSNKNDDDHVVALFKRHGMWGAISKTNHAVLRYREPVYKTIRELAMSYFHEYFLDTGEKTLRTYSQPFSLIPFAKKWITAEEDMWYLSDALDTSPHKKMFSPAIEKELRRADSIEIRAGKITEWK